jgi:hypothetical protein
MDTGFRKGSTEKSRILCPKDTELGVQIGCTPGFFMSKFYRMFDLHDGFANADTPPDESGGYLRGTPMAFWIV